jgi:hypothetical protein
MDRALYLLTLFLSTVSKKYLLLAEDSKQCSKPQNCNEESSDKETGDGSSCGCDASRSSKENENAVHSSPNHASQDAKKVHLFLIL